MTTEVDLDRFGTVMKFGPGPETHPPLCPHVSREDPGPCLAVGGCTIAGARHASMDRGQERVDAASATTRGLP